MKLCNKFSCILTLAHNDISGSSFHSKAEILNIFFIVSLTSLLFLCQLIFLPLIPFPYPQELKCSPNELFRPLSCFPSDTSLGLDKIWATILYCSVHIFSTSVDFNSSLSSGAFPGNCKNSFISYCILKLFHPHDSPLTTVQFLSCLW